MRFVARRKNGKKRLIQFGEENIKAERGLEDIMKPSELFGRQGWITSRVK